MNPNLLMLPPELMVYLRRRASRSGKTLTETVESLVREAMHYDALVSKMEVAPDPARGPVKGRN